MDNSASIVYNEKQLNELEVYLLAGSACCNDFEQDVKNNSNGEAHVSDE